MEAAVVGCLLFLCGPLTHEPVPAKAVHQHGFLQQRAYATAPLGRGQPDLLSAHQAIEIQQTG